MEKQESKDGKYSPQEAEKKETGKMADMRRRVAAAVGPNRLLAVPADQQFGDNDWSATK